ncbi:hypothetical protein BSFP_059460 [Burkholderia stabilis]|uniref:Uncharacterized protein n=1 Tax=Burkholderia stabilis TaxID=95485 RepID=A0A1Y1BXI1_9BURK|nr:hypothetical protein BSFP_059460 [Burkholderia stabilis]
MKAVDTMHVAQKTLRDTHPAPTLARNPIH